MKQLADITEHLNEILHGDCLEKIKELPSKSVDCVITSPPYWALRDYGVAGQLGLEPTFQEYITKLCDIFDEVKRVLKDEGTCWVNIGDTYALSRPAGSSDNGKYVGIVSNRYANTFDFGRSGANSGVGINSNKHKGRGRSGGGVPSKSLCCIPDRFKIEMINRGWICRNEIIWYKPNCMPSSVKDRFTVDYEKVFFFVKQKKYFFEQQIEKAKVGYNDLDFMPISSKDKMDLSATKTSATNASMERNDIFIQVRNKRCVWQVATKPFKEAHFATYPEALIEPMIKAGCPVNGVVLAPFFGSGTTGVVAIKQNKKFIGIELNSEYIEIAKKRIDEAIKEKQNKQSQVSLFDEWEEQITEQLNLFEMDK